MSAKRVTEELSASVNENGVITMTDTWVVNMNKKTTNI
jgi:hypothetical protein